ncbi:MAG: sterol desaturase family protein, partial [bacterium]
MNPLHEARLSIRRELEAPPALRKFGSGWISGVLGLMLGLAALGSVVMLRFPGVFVMKESASLVAHPGFRTGMLALLVLAFLFSMLSLLLRPGKVLGTAGMVTVLAAVSFGGPQAQAVTPDMTPLYFGLDFFVLRLLFTGFLFIPLETIFPHRAEQGIFRYEWREDLFYYLVSSMMVQMLTWLSFLPAQTLLAITSWSAFRAWVAALPFVVQFIAIMFLTDLVQY